MYLLEFASAVHGNRSGQGDRQLPKQESFPFVFMTCGKNVMVQLCGARGAGDAAAQGLYWVAKKGLSFMLALASERERNAAIMLARRFAFDSNVSWIQV